MYKSSTFANLKCLLLIHTNTYQIYAPAIVLWNNLIIQRKLNKNNLSRTIKRWHYGN